jgi:hypothetical protein
MIDTRWLLSLPIAFAVASCSTSSSSTTPPTEDASLQDSATADAEDPAIDPRAQARDTVRNEGAASQALTSLKGVLYGFMEDDPTLDPSKTAEVNTQAIVDRLTQEVNGCANVVISHDNAAASLSVNFGTAGCTLQSSGTVVTGQVSLVVSRPDAGLVSVALTLTNLGADGYSMSGAVTVTMVSVTEYRLDIINLTVDGIGVLNFTGTANAAATRDGGIVVGATLNGTGTFVSTGAIDAGSISFGSNGWICNASGGATTFSVNNLHRNLSTCYADAGTVQVTKSYTCSRSGLRRDASLSATAELTTSIAFATTTPQTAQVAVTVGGSIGDASVNTTSTECLPAHGTCGASCSAP